MLKQRRHTYVYYSLIGILLAIVFFLQTSTNLFPAVFGVKPNPAFILLLLLSMFGGEWAGIFGGLALGIATDVVSSAPDGFNSLFMMLAGLGSALMSVYLLNRRLPAAMVLTGGGALCYYLALWLVSVLPKGYDGVWLYPLRYSLPQAFYSFLFVFPFWWIMSILSSERKARKKHSLLD